MEKKKKDYLQEQVLYAGLRPEEYESITQRIFKKNAEALKSASFLAFLLFFALTIASFFVGSVAKNQSLYGIMLVIMLFIFLGSKFFLHRHIYCSILFFYLFLGSAFVFGIILGVVQQPHIPATTFCVLIFALPLLIIDKPYRISFFLVLMTMIFCIFTKNEKMSEIASLDTVNAVSFLFLGIAVNFFVMRMKVRDILGQLYIEKQRDTDDLTKLMTKAAFMRQVRIYMESTEKGAALLVIDLDNFKKVNDTMGHAYGDAVLRIMGKCIRETFSVSDFLARFGGDEFVLFLPEMENQEQVRQQVEKLVMMMEKKLSSANQVFSVTGSIGIAFYPGDGSDYDSLFFKADEALYASKGKGKNCYTFYLNRDLLSSES